eukprot:gene4907-6118_t
MQVLDHIARTLLKNALLRKIKNPNEKLVIHSAGDNGLGKTLTARLFSRVLFENGEGIKGDGEFLVIGEEYRTSDTLNSDSTEFSKTRLWNRIVNQLMYIPNSVIIIDEIQKFHPTVLLSLEPFLDGQTISVPVNSRDLDDTKNHIKIDTSMATFILTSDFEKEGMTSGMSMDDLKEMIVLFFQSIYGNFGSKLPNLVTDTIPFITPTHQQLKEMLLDQIRMYHCRNSILQNIGLNTIIFDGDEYQLAEYLYKKTMKLYPNENYRGIEKILNTLIFDQVLNQLAIENSNPDSKLLKTKLRLEEIEKESKDKLDKFISVFKSKRNNNLNNDQDSSQNVAGEIARKEFADFLESDKYGYKESIQKLIDRKEKRLTVNIDHFRAINPDLTKRFLSKPLNYLSHFQISLTTLVLAELKKNLLNWDQKDPMQMDMEELMEIKMLRKLVNDKSVQYYLAFEGSFGSYHVTPRGLTASFISRLICVEGIVTKCSLVRPKVIKSVHYCEKTKVWEYRSYADATCDSGIPTTSNYPTKDKDGNPLLTEYGFCEYKDSQMISIQEMPERAPAGQLPRSVDILLDNDLVDRVKPGDRVQAVGVYRAIPMSTPGQKNTKFRTMLACNSIKLLTKEIGGPEISAFDIQNIKNFSKNQENSFELLASSLAPSIYGHDFIKKSLLLLMLGGVEKNLNNGTHLRGDINLLMVGDPSTAKSQLLRFILNTAPLAINTTGRGSSGVGLTAAVTSDSETGERRLEAGAMVLADRGIVCIDEFDKMSHDDRVAIHEVMEQQTVTISKAGIHASLNARCSVVAAANPIYGQYNRYKKPHDNIGLPDSLLSRFDLLFIVLDNTNPDHDREISQHILRMHRYRSSSSGDHNEMDIQSEQISVLGGELHTSSSQNSLYKNSGSNSSGGGDDINTPIFIKYDKMLHGSKRANTDIVSIPFIQKYIQYAKSRIKPKLSDEARIFIIDSYTELRSKEEEKTLPITTRTLETMIRLSEAHAKCRLSFTVEIIDAEVAVDIMYFALFNEAKAIPKNIKRNNENIASDQKIETTAATQITIKPGSIPLSVEDLRISLYGGFEGEKVLEPGSIPSSVTTLDIDHLLFKHNPHGIIPDSVTDLTVNYWLSLAGETDLVPSSVQILKIYSVDHQTQFTPGCFPSTLTRLDLDFDDDYKSKQQQQQQQQQYQSNIIPSTIKNLTIRLPVPILDDPNFIPNSLESLCICIQDGQIIKPGFIPNSESVKKLELYSSTAGTKIENEILPSNITHFACRNLEINSSILGRLSNITEMSCFDCIEEWTPHIRYPRSLVRLETCINRISMNLLPSTLTGLKLSSEIIDIEIGSLPNSLTELEFSDTIKFKITKGILPDSLLKLTFRKGISTSIKDFPLIPNQVKDFTYIGRNRDYDLTIPPNALPDSLENLTIHYVQRQSLGSGIIPSNIKSVDLNGCLKILQDIEDDVDIPFEKLQYLLLPPIEISQSCSPSGSLKPASPPIPCQPYYYECVGGSWQHRTCPSGLLFSPSGLYCDWPIGYSSGYLLANESLQNYNVLANLIAPVFREQMFFELFMDWQWKDYLSKQFTTEYLEELQGFNDGAQDAGYSDLATKIARVIVISSFPGDIILNIETLLKEDVENIQGMKCSHYSVWGSRTVDGDMFNGRNLDWFQDTGLSRNKMIYIYHPNNGYAHAAITFTGLMGAITGISEKGIFTAESDNSGEKVTFNGLTWTYRLRHVMEYAETIDEAVQVWESTNNTMGMNHMLSAAGDVGVNPHPALALETMKGYTAYFHDNDTVEHYLYVNSTTHQQTQMGFPIPEAVYRTNHGYDPIIRSQQLYPATPDGDSMIRYRLFPQIFNEYQSNQILINDLQAINITSILGNKNMIESFFDCSLASTGGNIISATFHHSSKKMFVSYEEGTGTTRVCACCGTYVQIDLSKFF